MTRYLLDTNHMGRAIDRVSRLRDRIGQHRVRGDRFGTCVPVLCELEIGIQQTGHVDANHHRLNGLLQYVSVWPLDSLVIPLYARYYQLGKSRGQIVEPVDLFVAVLATVMKAVVLTTDNDFTALPEVPTENWIP